jgi:hypothetical protein
MILFGVSGGVQWSERLISVAEVTVLPAGVSLPSNCFASEGRPPQDNSDDGFAALRAKAFASAGLMINATTSIAACNIITRSNDPLLR